MYLTRQLIDPRIGSPKSLVFENYTQQIEKERFMWTHDGSQR
jgi:hypothetical protein